MVYTPRRTVSNLSVILRLLLYFCAAVLVMALVAIGSVAIINAKDEPLSARTLSWLEDPANPVPDAENAALAMAVVGIDAEPATAPQRGRHLLEALRALPPEANTEGVYARQGPLWHAEDVDSRLCSAKEDPNVLPRLLSQQKALRIALAKHQRALQRYYAAIALPGFHEINARYAIQDFQPQLKAACLARFDLSQRLMRGDASARPVLVQHLRHGLRSLHEGQTLLGAMIGQASIRNDLAWLTGLAAAHMPALDAVLRTLQPELEAFAHLPLAPFHARMARAEFHLNYPAFNTLMDRRSTAYQASPFWQRQLYPLTYQANASTNLLREMIEKTLDGSKAIDHAECQYMNFGVYNFIGKVLACIAVPDYAPYMTRLTRTQQDALTFLARRPGKD